MIRTSLILPAGLRQRLAMMSRREDKSLSELARELLDQALAKHEQTELKMMHQALRELDGVGDRCITDASTTIDDALYGEKGAWRGGDG
jgi:predicted DNA-binding protein